MDSNHMMEERLFNLESQNKEREFATVSGQALYSLCNEYMTFVRSGDYDCVAGIKIENKIFEAAMEMFFGKDVWDEINAAID